MPTHENLKGIFTGIKVLDLTKVYSGPLATRYLADYGAKVIKIENPNDPDPSRLFPPLVNNSSGYFEILNRNKENLYLNLKDSHDLEFFYDLVKSSDVVVENLSPNAKYKLKIDYETLKKINPLIIYASLSGRDQNNNDKYFDVIGQAESGLLSLSGWPDSPLKISPAVVDAFAGVNLAFAISSALYYRSVSGQGQNVFVSMLASTINMLEQNLVEYSITHHNPTRPGNNDNAIAPFGVYKTRDSHIVIAIGSENLWLEFIKLFHVCSDLSSDKYSSNQLRLMNQTELTQTIEGYFSNYSSSAILKKLKSKNIPCSLISEMSDVAKSKWFYDQGALLKMKHPLLGECIVPGRCISFSSDKSVFHHSISDQPLSFRYQFRQITPADLGPLTKLLDICFKIKNPNKKELIKWKFFDQKFLQSACLFGAFINDRLVSIYTNKQVPLSDRSDDYLAGLCLDMATDPEHRGKKLISRLSKIVYLSRQKDQFDISIGFSNESGVMVDKYSSGYGYSIVGQFSRYISISTPQRSAYQLRPTQELKSWSRLSLLHFSQNKYYLEWRYLRKPGNKYQILDVVNPTGKVVAQAIIIEFKSKIEIFKITTDQLDNIQFVLQSLRHYAFSLKKTTVVIRVLPNNFWKRTLRKSHFLPLNLASTDYYLTVKPLSDKIYKKTNFTNPESWFMMGGDIL